MQHSRCTSGFHTLLVLACLAPMTVAAQTPAAPQGQLLDRVLARTDSAIITLSDVRAAIGVGLTTSRDESTALQELINRELLLNEVRRFPPPEPSSAAVDAEVAAMTARVGTGLPQLTRSTGLDAGRIREAARDSLRIRSYLDQRFGATVQVSDDDVDRYYRSHLAEFVRNGVQLSFDEAEPMARQRAAAARRQMAIDQWLDDLRSRTEVAVNK